MIFSCNFLQFLVVLLVYLFRIYSSYFRLEIFFKLYNVRLASTISLAVTIKED
jgi:hypothetical protein